MLAIWLSLLDTQDEKERFTALYERYKRLVYDTARKVLHDDSLAEDILQETFLYLAENFTKIPTENCHKTASYLVITSRTRAITLLQKRTHETVGEGDAPDAAPDTAPLPEDAVISAARAARLVALVGELKEIYRDPLTLLAQGHTYPEIAGALNLPEPTVRKRVQRGRALLWKELNRDDE